MSNYPDNMPSAYRIKMDFICTTEGCPQITWEVPGVMDLGAFRADDDAETYCPCCGREGE